MRAGGGLVGAAFTLGPRDRMCILHRDLGAHFVRGVTPDRYLANYMGREGGVTGGKDGNMHFGDRELGCVGMVSMLPDMAQVATGMALSFKMRSEPRVAMTFFGEGSTANGQWHEAMNFAGIHRLPVVFVLENNQFAYSTPTDLEFAVDPVQRAKSYGFPGVSVDGNDVEAVFEVARVAADRAREGEGPTLIECHTMRMHGHGAHDDMSYVPDEMLAEWSQRDPIELYGERLADEHGFEQREIDRSGSRSPRMWTSAPSARWPRRCPTPRWPPRACSRRAGSPSETAGTLVALERIRDGSDPTATAARDQRPSALVEHGRAA